MKLIEINQSPVGQQLLSPLVKSGAISPEKKPFATDLGASYGPYMAVQEEGVMMDAASQIASLGLGFTATPSFGTGHHLESWMNYLKSDSALALKASYASTLLRFAGWENGNAFFCNSGAESNETALGQCFAKRKNKNARRVIAFRGSFHGRMLVSLSATWNPAKRAAFELPGYEASFADYPVMDSDAIAKPKTPAGWHALWESAGDKKFKSSVKGLKGKDALLDAEIASLLEVRDALLSGECFAILIEPMQCEGGDRYSSSRFHNGLLCMARAFDVPLIYDEIQTGFSLGGDFFWHRMFDLRDSQGNKAYPDYLVCAKKAQVGVVLSHEKITHEEQFSMASLVRGYVQAVSMDQNLARIEQIETYCRRKSKALVKKHKDMISSPRGKGLCFAVDFKDTETLMKFIGMRFEYGLLYYPAGSLTARFRINLAFTDADLDLLFSRLSELLDCLTKGKEPSPSKVAIPDLERFKASSQWLENQAEWMALKNDSLGNDELSDKQANALAKKVIMGAFADVKRKSDVKMVKISKRNWKDYRKRVQKIQKDVYELSRQTDISCFDAIFKDGRGFGLGVLVSGKLCGIAFGGPLSLFPYERGLRNDPSFNDPHYFYMVDVTIRPNARSRGLGRAIKLAFSLIAATRGVKAITGRNRDKLAAKMLGINLSMGAYETQHLANDYPDCEAHCDAIYYQMPLLWDQPELNLSRAVDSPLAADELSSEYISENLPGMLNKVSLANFVSPSYLKNMEGFVALLPKKLRHVYSGSSQAELVDKLFKALWLKRKPATKMVTFDGCYFGAGSFLSRGISGIDESFFEVDSFDFPTKEKQEGILAKLSKALKPSKVHSIWIEPLCQKSGKRVEKSFLVALRALCTERGIPLVYNETASAFERYQKGKFFASNDPKIAPDAAYSYLSGQMGVAFMKEEYFDATPLLLISTWDGDEFSFARYMKAVAWWKENRNDAHLQRKAFGKNLKKQLSGYLTDYKVSNGVGHFSGNIPPSLAKMFHKSSEGYDYLVMPSDAEIALYNQNFGQKGNA